MSEEKLSEEVVVKLNEDLDKIENDSVDPEGLLPEEIEMVKENGGTILGEEESSEESSEKEEVKEEKSEEVKEPEEEEQIVTFEDAEKNNDNVSKFNPNEKALYWKWKSDKQKRQEAQKERDEIKSKYELDVIKNAAAKSKLDKINSLLSNDSGLTVEELQQVINGEVDVSEDKNTPLTKADLEKIEQEKEEKVNQQQAEEKNYQNRLGLIEKIGVSKNENFDKIAELAKEVCDNDKTGTYIDIINNALYSDKVDESEAVDKIITIAQLSKKFNSITVSEETKENVKDEKVDRILKNSKKKVSSASVGGGGRTITANEITVEQAASLSQAEYDKLPRKVQERLLQGVNP